MTSSLGQAFYRAARLPLQQALDHLNAGRTVKGLEQLQSRNLEQGWKRGVEIVATYASVGPDHVEAAIDGSEAMQLLEEFDERLAALKPYHDQLSRGLSIPPGGTVAKRDTSVAEAVSRLAERYRLDPQLSGPLSELAERVAGFEQKLEQARKTLDNDRKLHARVHRKLMIRVLSIALVAGTVVGVAGWYGWRIHRRNAARERIEATLGAPDPCAVENILAEDLSFATDGQREKMSAHKKLCEKQRARQRRLAECKALAQHVREGKLTDKDKKVAGTSGELLERVASGQPQMSDLQVKHEQMPCQDTPAAEQLWTATAEQVGKAAALWGKTTDASDELVAWLKAHPEKWTGRSRKSLQFHAEALAKRGVKTGKASDLERGRKACALLQRLGEAAGRNCRALAHVDSK